MREVDTERSVWTLRVSEIDPKKFSVWSSILDDYLYTNLTEAQVVEAYGEMGRFQFEDAAHRSISNLRAEALRSELRVAAQE